jgi:hypothetical protein
VALVPASTRALRDRDIAYVPLTDRTPTVTSTMQWSTHQPSRVLERVLETAGYTIDAQPRTWVTCPDPWIA